MADRVLDQRLNEHRRNGGVLHLGSDIHLDLELIAETNLLDLEVMLKKGELFSQRDLLPVLRLQRHAQQIAEMLDHAAGQLRIALHVRRDGIERVEEKMRIELHSQGVEPRLAKLCSRRSSCNSELRYCRRYRNACTAPIIAQ